MLTLRYWCHFVSVLVSWWRVRSLSVPWAFHLALPYPHLLLLLLQHLLVQLLGLGLGLGLVGLDSRSSPRCLTCIEPKAKRSLGKPGPRPAA
jgi:hypothetical protein